MVWLFKRFIILTGTGYRSIIQVRKSPKVESVHLTFHLFITENTMSRWTESPFWDVNASAYTHILDNFIFSTLWEQFGDGNLVFQHAQQKARSTRTWISEFGVESLDLNPIEHLWDESEWRLRARPSRQASLSDLTNAVLKEWLKNSPKHTSKLCGKPRWAETVIASIGVPSSY